jgi:hypothetical protein
MQQSGEKTYDGLRTRLEFIEKVLNWRGYIRRKELLNRFDISDPLGTKDLSMVGERGQARYDVKIKGYRSVEHFKPEFITPDPFEDFKELNTLGDEDFFATPTIPLRKCDEDILKKLTHCASNKEQIDIYYYSVNSNTNKWRTISPRTFATDGMRFHVRAFCHENEKFQDFVIGRIQDTGKFEPSPFAHKEDEEWSQIMKVTLGINPKLKETQKKALEMDYSMEDGKFTFTTRKALQLYTLRNLGFIDKESQQPPFPRLSVNGRLVLLGIE